MTLTFEHVHILCEDVAVVGKFLVETIGAEELRRNPANMNWEFQLGPVRIFARQRRTDEHLADESVRRRGLDHIGFTTDDIEQEMPRLIDAGCVVVTGTTLPRAGVTTAFVMAPGGLLIELLQRN